jgi:DNA (cytosine-5)-methyltransferase 1
MPAHPNRSRRAPSVARNPSPDEIRAAREKAGLTQEAAGALVHASRRTWMNWEFSVDAPENRAMHPGLFELFLLKTGQLSTKAVA